MCSRVSDNNLNGIVPEFIGKWNLLGDPTGGVLILAHRRLKAHAHNLTWFGKIAYIHGRESILFRDRDRIQ